MEVQESENVKERQQEERAAAETVEQAGLALAAERERLAVQASERNKREEEERVASAAVEQARLATEQRAERERREVEQARLATEATFEVEQACLPARAAEREITEETQVASEAGEQSRLVVDAALEKEQKCLASRFHATDQEASQWKVSRTDPDPREPKAHRNGRGC